MNMCGVMTCRNTPSRTLPRWALWSYYLSVAICNCDICLIMCRVAIEYGLIRYTSGGSA